MATATTENGALRTQNETSVFWSYLLTSSKSTTTTLALSKNTIAAWPKAA